MPNMKATTLTARELVFTVGSGDMSQLAGQEVYVTKQGIKGWFGGGVAVRRTEQKRLWTHGNFSLPGTRDGRLVSITGVAWGPTRRSASELKDRLNALMADGNIGRLTIIDPDEGTRWANCYLTGTPEVDWDYDDTLTWTLDFVCPNPRRFGVEATYNTGISEQGEGLQFPLFTGGPYVVTRTNLATNPSVQGTSVNYGTAPGSGTAPLTRQGSGGLFGPQFMRQTWTASGTGGGITYTQPLTNVTAAGVPMSVSWWVRSNVAKSVAVRAAFRNSSGVEGTGLGSKTSPFVTLAAGVWTEMKVEGLQSTQAAADLLVTVVVNPSTVSSVTDNIGVDGLMIEAASSVRGPYFDGETANDTTIYEWTGTANASTSTASVSQGAQGVLDFGEPGRAGTITVNNYGTADTYPEFWVNGFTPEFTITELETGRQLQFVGTVPRFQTLFLSAANGAVYLDAPDANRLEGLGRDEWPVIPGNSTRTYLFDSPLGPEARLFLKVAPAWW